MLEFRDVLSILIIKLRYVGDSLMLIPAARALKETFPEAQISVLVSPGAEKALSRNPLFDEIIVFDPATKNLPALARAKGELRFASSIREKEFDMAVDLNGNDRSAMLSYFSGARYRLGYDMKGKGFWGKRRLYTHLAGRPDLKEHVILRDYNLVRHFGIKTEDLSVDAYASWSDEAHIEGLLAENKIKPGDLFVHVHPSSRLEGKCWTEEGMAFVMDRLNKEGLRPVMTSGTGKAELDRAGKIISLMKTKPVDLIGRIGLNHLASLSRRAFLYFGVDSAPMHIAAAVDTPVIALFGPSGAFNWGPWDNGKAAWPADMTALAKKPPYGKRNGIQSFGKHMVIQKDWDCAPCGKDGCDNSKKSQCLKALEKEEVLKAIAARIETIGIQERF